MSSSKLDYLLELYLSDTISKSDFELLWRTINQPEHEAFWKKNIDKLLQDPLFHQLADAEMVGMAWEKAKSATRKNHGDPAYRVHRIRFFRATWFRYAAAVMLLFGISAYLYTIQRSDDRVAATKPAPVNDIPPGRDGALLTLADGTQVILDSLGNGMVAEQNGAKVLLEDGRLFYNASNARAVAYNTMTTPKGRRFSIRLPDGSQAWLNAASSITFPTAFVGEERSVHITGEVYFEIAHNAKMPLKVKVNNDLEIQVLGTSFNVRAYQNDSSINTTLLEGAVRVSAHKRLQTLRPGQQTQVTPDGEIKLVNNADIEKVMAWRNGVFNGCIVL